MSSLLPSLHYPFIVTLLLLILPLLPIITCYQVGNLQMLHFSPQAPISGLAWRGRRREAQLDRVVCFLCLSQPTLGLAQRVLRRGCLRNGESAFHRLWESPTASARKPWRKGIWTTSLHPCASRHQVLADGGLAGRTAAAAGSGGSCWQYQECSQATPSPSWVLCC